jgi:hypothetical protein
MRVELWRLSDERPFNTHDVGVPVSRDGLAELARDILMGYYGYYEGDDRFFWPKPSYGDKAPQGVRIVPVRSAAPAKLVGGLRLAKPRLLLALEAPDSAGHLDPGLRLWIASLRLRERAGDGESGSEGHRLKRGSAGHYRN